MSGETALLFDLNGLKFFYKESCEEDERNKEQMYWVSNYGASS